MKRIILVLVLLALLVIPVTTQAEGIPWGGGDPIVQPMGFPFYCCRCSYCINFVAWYGYTVCNCGYFDGCSNYPPCGPASFRWTTSCDCP
jgi:hypothetical protein